MLLRQKNEETLEIGTYSVYFREPGFQANHFFSASIQMQGCFTPTKSYFALSFFIRFRKQYMVNLNRISTVPIYSTVGAKRPVLLGEQGFQANHSFSASIQMQGWLKQPAASKIIIFFMISTSYSVELY